MQENSGSLIKTVARSTCKQPIQADLAERLSRAFRCLILSSFLPVHALPHGGPTPTMLLFRHQLVSLIHPMVKLAMLSEKVHYLLMHFCSSLSSGPDRGFCRWLFLLDGLP